jgi:hypothetical protein
MADRMRRQVLDLNIMVLGERFLIYTAWWTMQGPGAAIELSARQQG